MPLSRYPTWILVADSRTARVLVLDAPGARLVVAEELHAAVPGHAHDLKSSAPGRAFSSAGSAARHAMEPRTDPLVHEKHEFARRIARLVDEGARQRRFRRLVVVAPPKMLGDLRAEMGNAAAKLVTVEVPHDYVGMPATELPARLAGVL
ncbi:MAG: host attachment protein [Alphaproteobacteria bacterium]